MMQTEKSTIHLQMPSDRLSHDHVLNERCFADHAVLQPVSGSRNALVTNHGMKRFGDTSLAIPVAGYSCEPGLMI